MTYEEKFLSSEARKLFRVSSVVGLYAGRASLIGEDTKHAVVMNDNQSTFLSKTHVSSNTIRVATVANTPSVKTAKVNMTMNAWWCKHMQPISSPLVHQVNFMT